MRKEVYLLRKTTQPVIMKFCIHIVKSESLTLTKTLLKYRNLRKGHGDCYQIEASNAAGKSKCIINVAFE